MSVPTPTFDRHFAPKECYTFQVWRIDDNGNVFAVGEPTSDRDARCQLAMYEARGHKQTYWVERVK